MYKNMNKVIPRHVQKYYMYLLAPALPRFFLLLLRFVGAFFFGVAFFFGTAFFFDAAFFHAAFLFFGAAFFFLLAVSLTTPSFSVWPLPASSDW